MWGFSGQGQAVQVNCPLYLMGCYNIRVVAWFPWLPWNRRTVEPGFLSPESLHMMGNPCGTILPGEPKRGLKSSRATYPRRHHADSTATNSPDLVSPSLASPRFIISHLILPTPWVATWGYSEVRARVGCRKHADGTGPSAYLPDLTVSCHIIGCIPARPQ